MKRLFLLLLFGVIVIQSKAALTPYQQEVLDGANSFLDTLLSRFIEQPENIQGVFIKFEKVTWLEDLFESPSDPGTYSLELLVNEQGKFLKWGGGESVNIEERNEVGELKLEDSSGKKIVAQIWGSAFLPEVNSSDEIKIRYSDYSDAYKFANSIVNVKYELSKLNGDPYQYQLYSNAIWKIYIGSLSQNKVDKLEDIGTGLNTADALYDDEAFNNYVDGLYGIYDFCITAAKLGFMSEDEIKFTIFEKLFEFAIKDTEFAFISTLLDVYNLDIVGLAQKLLLEFVKEYVNYVKAELVAYTLKYDSYQSDYESRTSYALFILEAKNPDGNFDNLRYKHFFNLSAISTIPGYTSAGFGPENWYDNGYPLVPDRVNNMSVCLNKSDLPKNNFFIEVSLYDNDFGTIAYKILKSTDIDISGIYPYFTRFDFGIFLPASFINNHGKIKLAFYQEDNWLGNHWFELENYGGNSDLPPASPNNFSGIVNNDTKAVDLNWSPNTEEDFKDYIVYKTTSSQEILNDNNLIFQGTDTCFYDVNLVAGDTYYYQIVATDIGGNKSNATSIKVEVPPLVAEFIAFPAAGLVPHSPIFANSSSGFFPIVSYEWDLNGDGIIDSEEKNPSYTYSEIGEYDVSLTVTDSKGLTVTETKVKHVGVFPEGSAEVRAFPDKTEYEINEFIKIPVTMAHYEALFAFACDFYYDREYLEFINAVEGDCISQGEDGKSLFNFFNDLEEGMVTLGIARSDTTVVNVQDTSLLMTLFFQARKTIENTELGFLPNIGVIAKDGEFRLPCSYNNYYIDIHGSDRSSKMYVDANNSTPKILDTISVDIGLNDVDNLWAYDFELEYNSNVLKPTKVNKGSIFSEEGKYEAFFWDNSDPGKLLISSALLNETIGVFTDSRKTVAEVEFLVINEGYSNLEIENESLILPNGTEVISSRTYGDDILVKVENDSPKAHILPDKEKYAFSDQINLFYTIANAEDLYSLSTDIVVDSDSLQIYNINETGLLDEDGSISTTLLKYEENDRIIVGYSRMNQSAGGITISDADTILQFQFEPVASGKINIGLENTAILNAVAESYPVFSSDTFVYVNHVPVIETVFSDSIWENNTYNFSWSSFDFTDLDDSLENIIIQVFQGENYSVSELTILPVTDFIGELKIPVQLYDGYDYSTIDTFRLKVKELPENTVCQSLSFDYGWNIFSANTNPLIDDILSNFQLLIDNGSLIKIQDEDGWALEDQGIFGGWVNNIGDISSTEGYKVKVNTDQSIQICGMPVDYPFQIPLKEGWNIIGYPQLQVLSAMDIIQPLIDNGTLIKVQDEEGNTIENWGIYGGWQNMIGNFQPGEGYKVKVAESDTLWIYESYPKSLAKVSPLIPTRHFQTGISGNGTDHMNFNLVNVSGDFLNDG